MVKTKKKNRGPYHPRHDSLGLVGREREFICDKCGMKTNRKNNLLNHWNVHLKNRKKFRCEICSLKLSKLSHLKRHVKRKHGDIVEKHDVSTNVIKTIEGTVRDNNSDFFEFFVFLKFVF